MRKDKNLAVKLRKEGNSYKQISKKLNIPKSTLSCWLKDLKISDKARAKIADRVYEKSILALIGRNKAQTVLAKERADLIKKEAEKNAKNLLKDPLFIAGISLYWAEGYKKGDKGSKYKSVDFTNSDPEMIIMIMKFFRKFYKVSDDRIKIQLMAHPNINITKAVKFWMGTTGLKKTNFTKTIIVVSSASKRKRNFNTLINGTIHLRIFDVKLFFKTIGWINGLKKYL
jgi:hypothetical protein